MTLVIALAVGALIGYAFGAIPTGYFVGKLWNVDVRKHGSGRTGGTNVLRTIGWRAFVLTVVGDALKGIVPVLISQAIYPAIHSAHVATVLGVLVGNNWSLWITLLTKPDPSMKFDAPPLGWIQRVVHQGRGGAGITTTAGAVLALFPPVPLIIVPFGIGALLITKYASVGSLTAATLFPIVMGAFVFTGNAPISYFILSIIVCILQYIIHRPNIERLRAGNERRFGARLGQRPTRSQ